MGFFHTAGSFIHWVRCCHIHRDCTKNFSQKTTPDGARAMCIQSTISSAGIHRKCRGKTLLPDNRQARRFSRRPDPDFREGSTLGNGRHEPISQLRCFSLGVLQGCGRKQQSDLLVLLIDPLNLCSSRIWIASQWERSDYHAKTKVLER